MKCFMALVWFSGFATNQGGDFVEFLTNLTTEIGHWANLVTIKSMLLTTYIVASKKDSAVLTLNTNTYPLGYHTLNNITYLKGQEL